MQISGYKLQGYLRNIFLNADFPNPRKYLKLSVLKKHIRNIRFGTAAHMSIFRINPEIPAAVTAFAAADVTRYAP